MKILATYSIKGGVGKTTTAVNLAYEGARAGARIVVWDLDPQCGATYLFRVRPKVKGGSRHLVGERGALWPHLRGSDVPGVDVVPGDFSLRHLDLHLDAADHAGSRLANLLEALRDSYDIAIVDCPPSISLASESVFDAVDALVVPVVPATLASRTLAQLADFLEDRPEPPALLPVLSMVDLRKRLHRDVMASLAAEWPSLFETFVPTSSAVERLGVERAPVGTFAPRSAGALAFQRLWGELAGILWPSPLSA